MNADLSVPGSFLLLFLHGAGMSDKDITKYLQDMLRKKSVENYSFNFTGHGGDTAAMATTSLEKRLAEAENAIRDFPLAEPLNLCGSSMGGYIAIKLLEKYRVNNLILFAPAVYDIKAFTLPFDTSFTETIRQKESWKNSDAFSILKNYTGNVLLFIGDKDDVIPQGVIQLMDESLSQARSKEFIVIPGCTHKIHKWLKENEEWSHLVTEKIVHLLQ